MGRDCVREGLNYTPAFVLMTFMDGSGLSHGAGGLRDTPLPPLWLKPAVWYVLHPQGGVPVDSAPYKGWDAKLGCVQG